MQYSTILYETSSWNLAELDYYYVSTELIGTGSDAGGINSNYTFTVTLPMQLVQSPHQLTFDYELDYCY